MTVGQSRCSVGVMELTEKQVTDLDKLARILANPMTSDAEREIIGAVMLDIVGVGE